MRPSPTTACVLAPAVLAVLAVLAGSAHALHLQTPARSRVTSAPSTVLGGVSHAEASNVMAFHADGDLLGNGGGVTQVFLFDQGQRSNSGLLGLSQVTFGARPSRNPTTIDRGSVLAFESQADFLGTGSPGWQIYVARPPRPAIGRGPLVQLTRGPGESTAPLLAGKYLVFASTLDLLGRGLAPDVHLYRSLIGQVGGTTCPSYPCAGNPGLELVAPVPSRRASVTLAGDVVAFESAADVLGDGEANGFTQVFVRRFPHPPIRLTAGLGDSGGAQVSGDGSTVVFESDADLLGTGSMRRQIFLADLTVTPPALVQVTSGVDGDSTDAVITHTADRVAFRSTARLAGLETFGVPQVFFYERHGPRLSQLTADVLPQGPPALNLTFLLIPSRSDILGDGNTDLHLFLLNAYKIVGDLPPKPTATRTVTPTPTRTATPTAGVATPGPEETGTPAATATPGSTPDGEATATPSATVIDGGTATPTASTTTATPTPTKTKQPTPTRTPTPTPLPSPVTEPRALLECQRRIVQSFGSRAKAAAQMLGRCVEPPLACAEKPAGARDACVRAARGACLRAAAAWRIDARSKAESAIARSCAPARVASIDLVGAQGLGFEGAAEACETHFGADRVSDPVGLGRCLQDAFECRVEHLLGVAVPRSPALLAALDVDPLRCVDRSDPWSGAGDGTADETRCQRAAGRASAAVMREVLRVAERCGTRALACGLAGDAGGVCRARATTACHARFAALAAGADPALQRPWADVARRCGAVPAPRLFGTDGLDYGRHEALCGAVGVPALGDARQLAHCTVRVALCAVRDLLALGFPRLTDALGVPLATLPCPSLPADAGRP